MRWGRYWIFRRFRLTVRTRWFGLASTTFERKPHHRARPPGTVNGPLCV